MRRRRNADGPGRAWRHGSSCLCGLVADGRAGIRINRHVDGHLAEKLPFPLEDLDATVASVGYVNVSLGIDGDAVRRVELTRLVARLSPRFEPVAVLIDLGDAGVDVSIADVGVSGCVPSHIGHLAKHSVHGWQRRFLQWPSSIIRSFLLAPEYHDHAALGIELN